jgi:hypothetical protein
MDKNKGDLKVVFLCDTHLSRKKTEGKDLGVGQCFPKEDTWLDKENLQMMERQIAKEKQIYQMENSFIERVLAAAQSQFEAIRKEVSSKLRYGNQFFEFFTLAHRQYNKWEYPLLISCDQDILYRRTKEKIIVKIKEMFGPTFNIYAGLNFEEKQEYDGSTDDTMCTIGWVTRHYENRVLYITWDDREHYDYE